MATGLAKAKLAGKLDGYFGVTLDVQRQVGTLILGWGMFENVCELLIWRLKGENPSGKRPSTDGKPISDLLKAAGDEAIKLHGDSRKIVGKISSVGSDLLMFRNAIMHGRLTADAVIGPHLVSNAAWIGEHRKRQAGRATLNSKDLDVASEISEVLFRSTMGFIAQGSSLDTYTPESIYAIIAELNAAGVKAKYLRDIVELGERAEV